MLVIVEAPAVFKGPCSGKLGMLHSMEAAAPEYMKTYELPITLECPKDMEPM